MKEVVILEPKEYKGLTDELRELRLKERKYNEAIKRVYEHNFKDDILVVDIDIKKLNKLFGFEENSKVILFENK